MVFVTTSAVATFEEHRRYLRSLAYRMLGSVAEAEDIVQEAFLRWQNAEPDALLVPRAWLSTVVVRLCLDVRKSARTRYETYVGPWLPEPDATAAEPTDRESISLAFLVLLESLSPAERGAYLLHEVFDYSFAEVAGILDKEEATCRQLCHRAREHVTRRRPRFAPSRAAHERLLQTFLQAVTLGDLAGLQHVLAEDVTAYSDGGGKVRAARRLAHGADAVARLFMGAARKNPLAPDAEVSLVDVNCWPAFVVRQAGRATIMLGIETDGEHIYGVHFIVNPDKLARL